MLRPARVSAAAASGGRCAIVTLNFGPRHDLVDTDASIAVELGTDAHAPRRLLAELNDFLERNSIDCVMMRMGEGKDKMFHRAIRIKLEFLLAHRLKVPVDPVLSKRVPGWVNPQDLELPVGLSKWGKKFRVCQKQALETCYFATYVDRGKRRDNLED